jgi:hypothetical protein
MSVTVEEASSNSIMEGGDMAVGGGPSQKEAIPSQLSTSPKDTNQNLSSPLSSPTLPGSSRRKEKVGDSISSKSSSSRRFHEIFFARKSKGFKPNFLDTHLTKADSRQMVFMQAPDKEVSNTGFSFSHEEGMGDVICSPSR